MQAFQMGEFVCWVNQMWQPRPWLSVISWQCPSAQEQHHVEGMASFQCMEVVSTRHPRVLCPLYVLITPWREVHKMLVFRLRTSSWHSDRGCVNVFRHAYGCLASTGIFYLIRFDVWVFRDHTFLTKVWIYREFPILTALRRVWNQWSPSHHNIVISYSCAHCRHKRTSNISPNF